MKTYTLVTLALVLLSFRLTTQAQSVQPNGLQDRQITRLPIVGANVSQGISRDFLGAPSKHRLQTDLVTGIDSLRVKGSSFPFPNGSLIHNGPQRNSSPSRKMLSSQSQISVIDTVIVRSLGGNIEYGTYPGDTMRHVYSFNGNGRRTSDLIQKLTGGLWVDSMRETNTYDANGHELSELWEQWSNGQWVNLWRYTYTYDANGNELSLLYEQWSNGQWVNIYRVMDIRDANGNVLTQLWEDWTNGQWVNSWHYTYTYNANGNMLTELDGLVTNGQSVNSYRFTYTYDANGHELSELDELWSNGQWVNYVRYTYTYDANGNVLTYLWEDWTNGQWVNSERYTHTYDANGNVLTQLWEDWTNGQWVNNELDTYTYDVNGNVLSYLDEGWSNGQWQNSGRTMFTYDVQGNLTSFWHYSWLNSSWTPADLFSKRGVAVTDNAGNHYQFYLCYNLNFIYKLIVTGVASQNASVPAIYSLSQNYPNPFNPSTTIGFMIHVSGFTTLKVYDVLGREVRTLVSEELKAGSYETTFDASGLASGVYLYRLQAGDFVQTKKLTLLR